MGFLSNVLDFFGIGKSGKAASGSSSIFVTIGGNLITAFTEGFSTAVTSIIGAGGVIATKITDIINAAKSALGITGDGDSSVFSGIGTSVMDGLKSGMEDAFGSIETFLRDLFAQLPDWAKRWLGISSPSTVFAEIGEDIIGGLGSGIGGAANDYIVAASPSKLFAEIGRNTMTGMAQGILSSSGTVYDAMESAISSSAIAPAMNMQATMQAPAVSSQAPINFGDVTINNGMDWAVFKAQVQRAILES
jgi:branched-subunit amino acid transport protein